MSCNCRSGSNVPCASKSCRNTGAGCRAQPPAGGAAGVPLHFFAHLTPAQVVTFIDNPCVSETSPASPVSPATTGSPVSPVSPVSPATSPASPPTQVRAAADVDTAACGRVWLWFSPSFDCVKYRIEVFGATRVVQARLAIGPAGFVGTPVAILFDAGSGGAVDVNGVLQQDACLRNNNLLPCVQGPVNIAELYTLVREAAVYVDLVSLAYPDGVLRGQVFSP